MKKSFVESLTVFFTAWGQVTRVLEATLIDNLAATIPWLAPVVPAYMIYKSLAETIHFPLPVAILSAVVVEFLGLVTVSTSVQFWTWNDSKRQADPQAPVRLAVVTAGAYLAIVITVNVILDLGSPIEQLFAKALLSTLSVSAALTIAIRSQHARRLAEIEQSKAQKRAERRERQLSASSPVTSGEIGDFQKVAAARKVADWRRLTVQEKEAIAGLPTRDLVEIYPISERTAREWIEKSRKNGYHEARNG